MSSFGKALRRFFFGHKPEVKRPKTEAVPMTKKVITSATPRQQQSRSAQPSTPSRPKRQKVQLLQLPQNRSPVPYWRLRRWRHVAENLYLGYFKTPLGHCHGVIKWHSRLDYSIYVHNVPQVILKGPLGGCFTEVKPKKFRVHFAQQPRDLNSAIFYMETLLKEAFENG